MLKYSGYDCPVCNKPFGEGEDIVVCPVCGAPHHRECYKRAGGCGLEANHAKGISWEDHVRSHTRQQSAQGGSSSENASYGADSNTAVQRCPACGSINPADGIFCQVCGTMMQNRNSAAAGSFGSGAAGTPFQGQAPGYQQGAQNPYANAASSPYGGMNPEDHLGEATVKEVATYVGPSSGFYLSRFRLSAANGNRNMSFCWSGFLFGFLYFFYRKVYRVAVPLLIIFLFSLLPSFVYSYEYLRELMVQYGAISFPLPVISTPVLDQLAVLSNICQIAQFVVAGLMGFTGHKLYLQDINRKIAAVKAENASAPTDQYIRALSKTGGVSPVLPAVIAGVLVFAYFAASMAIAMVLKIGI